MPILDRRTFVRASIAGATALTPVGRVMAQTGSLQDVGSLFVASPKATIYTAREIVTLDPARPAAEAVAVVDGRILWVAALRIQSRSSAISPTRSTRPSPIT